MIPTRDNITAYFQQLQDRICNALETADGTARFHQDLWERAEGGGGRTRIIQGQHIEKGGVNFSAVHGPMPKNIAKSLGFDQVDFYATGVSIVLHPSNPHVPIIHMNVRYFETNQGDYWFGGGIDLTPHYVVEEDARFFHQQLKSCCDAHHPAYYPAFKKWADDYFFVRHRKETRGIGGIFFDRLNDEGGFTKQERFDFVRAVGEAFAPTYVSLFEKNKNRSFSEEEKNWQLLRRGRYVEFNLVWDRGTKFGLETDGRIESILMSLPPYVEWQYNHVPDAGSREAETLAWLRKGVEWV